MQVWTVCCQPQTGSQGRHIMLTNESLENIGMREAGRQGGREGGKELEREGREGGERAGGREKGKEGGWARKAGREGG